MHHLFTEAVRLLQREHPFVLATVVETRGSTPQKAGARLLVRGDGTIVGTLGGGCVEAEVWQEAMTILRDGGGPCLREFSLSDDLAAESGMVCGGTMAMFIDPVTAASRTDIIARVFKRSLVGSAAVALATVITTSQESYLGAKLLLEGDEVSGSLGERSWDEVVMPVARDLQATGRYRLIEVDQDTRVFVEGLSSPPTLLVVGAGHIAQALCPVAKHLGLRVAVLDDRPDFANRERFPEVDEVIVAQIPVGIGTFPTSTSTAIIIATRGHKQDYIGLKEAVLSPAGYVGMVSSRRKVVLIYLQLLEEGIPFECLQKVHAPVGLDIGARTPQEIALSILAEVVMIRSGKRGGSLKLDEGRLHRVEGKRPRSARAG